MVNIKVDIKNIEGKYKFINLFQYFDNGLRKRLPKGIADEFKKQLIQNIDNNRFNFQLSRSWERYKTSIGADTRPFIMFGYYKNAIEVVVADGHLSVGFRSTVMHPRAKVSMGKLAVLLEYGDPTKGIPARPLWRNTADNLFHDKRAVIEKIISNAIKGQ